MYYNCILDVMQDEEDGFLEKDELPTAQEQMGMYRPLQNRTDHDISTEDLDQYVRDRFVAPSQRNAEVGDEQANEVGQQGLQPTPQDPKLWLVECKTGSEREAVISLMQKCVDLSSKGTPLAIKAVFTQDHLKVGFHSLYHLSRFICPAHTVLGFVSRLSHSHR